MFLANGQVASRKVKLVGEIVGKQAVHLLRWVDGKNCKWESTTYKLESLYKTPLLTVYGVEDDITVMDKLYHIISDKNIRFVYFSTREIENVKKLNLHNWMSFDEFMKGENKVFKRTVTAYLIKKFRENMFKQVEYVNGFMFRADEFSGTASNWSIVFSIFKQK